MTSFIRRVSALIWRVYRGVNKKLIHLFLPLVEPVDDQGLDLKRFGTDYGGWTIPINFLDEKSICYCIGVGVDASFDFALIENFQAKVYSFDPTPLAKEYMENASYDRTSLTYLPVGVWSRNQVLKFYAPANPTHTSNSVYDLHGTNRYIEAECKTIATLMDELGHKEIDLLKLDIEGAWSDVVENMVDEKIKISILCIELDSPVSLFKVRHVIRRLSEVGLSLAHIEKDNYLFLSNALRK